MEEVVKKVFEDLFKNHSNAFSKVINEPKENPILNYLLNKKELDLKICDDIICNYLNYIEPLSNEKYFIFATKFVILCNEFFSNFLEKYQFFDFNDEDKGELIEIIQHFCFWLFINCHTKSKLSLAS